MARTHATPAERSLLGKYAVERSWAQTEDRTARTAAARAAFDRKFDDEVDPDRVLDPAERARRAAHARKAHFAKLALASSKARRRNLEG